MTKEELSKLNKINAEIEQIKRELNNVEPQYVSDSVTASSKEFPYTAHQVKIKGYDFGACDRKVQRIQNRLKRKIEELMDERDKISEYIYSLDDSDLRQILTYRYVNGLTWGEIGNFMNYAAITVRAKHDKYIKSISPNITLKVIQ